MVMKVIKGILGIPAKRKVKSLLSFGKNKHDFELYEHYKGGLYRLLLTARCVSLKTNSKNSTWMRKVRTWTN